MGETMPKLAWDMLANKKVSSMQVLGRLTRCVGCSRKRTILPSCASKDQLRAPEFEGIRMCQFR